MGKKKTKPVITQEWLDAFLDDCEHMQLCCDSLVSQKESDLKKLDLDDAVETLMHMIGDCNRANQKLFDCLLYKSGR